MKLVTRTVIDCIAEPDGAVFDNERDCARYEATRNAFMAELDKGKTDLTDDEKQAIWLYRDTIRAAIHVAGLF